MTQTKPIQRKRTLGSRLPPGAVCVTEIKVPRVVNMRREACTVTIARPSQWGNPRRMASEQERIEVIHRYHKWVITQPQLILALPKLRGETLGCYCKPKPCHGDVLVRLFLQYNLYCVQRAMSKLKRTLKYGQQLHSLVRSLNLALDREAGIEVAIEDHRRLYPWIEERALVMPERGEAGR